jgi:hypothetical protein
MRPLVYIACPITAGNRNHNYFQACEAERQLMLAGFAPHNPAHTMVLPFAWQDDFPHSLWLDCCFPVIAKCDAVLRLPGYSVGADAELRFAAENGIPVFYSTEDLEEWRQSSDFADTRAAEKTAPQPA